MFPLTDEYRERDKICLILLAEIDGTMQLDGR